MTTPAKSRVRPRVMTLTQAAADRINALMATKPEAAALKVGIKKGGCAGMEYSLNWVDAPGKFDEVVEDKGARVLVDPTAIMYLLGTEMDFKVNTLSAQFVFNNPNQTWSCGCGESVTLTPAGEGKLESTDA